MPTTPIKKAPDNRKWCLHCTYKIKIPIEMDAEKFQLKNLSRFGGFKPKKSSSVCMRCQVALCQSCFRPWHDEEGLPPAPPDLDKV
jgi:hypothetical protein